MQIVRDLTQVEVGEIAKKNCDYGGNIHPYQFYLAIMEAAKVAQMQDRDTQQHQD